MDKKHTILVVDDKLMNRRMLGDMLSDEYNVLEAEDGAVALELVKAHKSNISAIVLDLVMPNLDGFGFLEQFRVLKDIENIPIIVATSESGEDNEAECLKLGAWDFVKKPYNAEIIKYRIKHAINRSEYNILKELRFREQVDSVTGLYKRGKFIEETQIMLEEHPDEDFAMVHFDIYKFQIFNTLFGMKEGNNLLKYIAQVIKSMSKTQKYMTYCHMEADIFAMCVAYESEAQLAEFLQNIRKELNLYKENYNLVPAFGVYVIEAKNDNIRSMLDKAKLASKECKGNYVKSYAFYTNEISMTIFKEQEIVNNMKTALDEEQFVLYLQPKYELLNNTIQGAEVLVRWKDPQKGMISPGDFIPVFERNGFIMELDYYVWEHTCQLLRKWIDEGRSPSPLSVNLSRVSLYNPNLVSCICGLVEKYNIPPALLQLELTETAYTSNPDAIKSAMSELQKRGFCILMDDFGSGYSSLNVLKDIAVDVLKIDMKFMSKSDYPGRSENILASVVRMAKWLNMPVIAEGVEIQEQVSFLKSISCEYVQGFYFARPMPIEEYEKLAFETPKEIFNDDSKSDNFDSLWTSESQMEMMLSNMLQAVAVYEFDGDNNIETIRVNNAYYDIFGFKNLSEYRHNVLDYVAEDYRDEVRDAFKEAVYGGLQTECEFVRRLSNGQTKWINLKLKYVNSVGDRHVIVGNLSDITMTKEADKELQKYRKAFSSINKEQLTFLVVDDMSTNRRIVKRIFEGKYQIIEAENGQDALNKLEERDFDVDLILLDLWMPVMDGKELLEIRANNEKFGRIPVIVITSEDSEELQQEMLDMGVNDYILKPFVDKAVARRVDNVLDSTRVINRILNECE